MHANVQTRFNPATGDMAPYYRIKESYRDVQGHVHSLILLNIGFEPSLTAVQVRKIAGSSGIWSDKYIKYEKKPL